MEVDIQQAERIVLEQVKFLNFILQEIRKRNKTLGDQLGMSYAKMIGLGTPYEEMINISRKVKGEFDQYLHIIRAEMVQGYERRIRSVKRKRRPGS